MYAPFQRNVVSRGNEHRLYIGAGSQCIPDMPPFMGNLAHAAFLRQHILIRSHEWGFRTPDGCYAEIDAKVGGYSKAHWVANAMAVEQKNVGAHVEPFICLLDQRALPKSEETGYVWKSNTTTG